MHNIVFLRYLICPNFQTFYLQYKWLKHKTLTWLFYIKLTVSLCYKLMRLEKLNFKKGSLIYKSRQQVMIRETTYVHLFILLILQAAYGTSMVSLCGSNISCKHLQSVKTDIQPLGRSANTTSFQYHSHFCFDTVCWFRTSFWKT